MTELEKIAKEFTESLFTTKKGDEVNAVLKDSDALDCVLKAFQAGRSSTIAKIREKMKTMTSDYADGPIQGAGFHECLDQVEKTLTNVEENDGN